MGTDEHTSYSDLEVIQAYLLSKDTTFFRILYKRYASKVYDKCLSLLKDEHLASDATQEIFLKIFLNLGKFQAQSKFSTWIYSITYNYCIDLIRRQKKVKDYFEDNMDKLPHVQEDGVPDKILLEMEVNKLRVVLDNIPIDDKAILLMKYQDDLMIREIALILGKSESAVKMKILRAKQKAQAAYNSLFPEPQ